MILIRNARYVIQDADHVLTDADILIDGKQIVNIGKQLAAGPDCRILDASGKAAMPGFVNMHTHLYQNMLKGMRDDLLLEPWCEQVTFPFSSVIKKHIREEQNYDLVYDYGLLGAMEMLHGGITSFVDMDLVYDPLFEAWRDAGIRGTAAIQAVNKWVPKELMISDEQRKKDIVATIDRWHGKDGLMVAVAPSTPFNCTPDFIRFLQDLCLQRGLGYYCHVSENKWEIEQSVKNTGMTPLMYMDSIGALSCPLCAVHGVLFTEEEKALAKEKKVTVCYNPKSNMKLGSGIAPVAEYLRMGIPVVLGTDGAASNDLLDMFEDMRTGLLMQHLRYNDPSCMSARDAFRMATQSGAEYLGINAGVLKEGKDADIVLMDTDKAHFAPVHDIVRQIVYCGKESDVETVLINGRVVMENGTILTVDEKKATEKAVSLAEERCREAENRTLNARHEGGDT